MFERLALQPQTFHARDEIHRISWKTAAELSLLTPRETVYGGGIYDGHFNIDPMHDNNGIFSGLRDSRSFIPHLKDLS